MVFDGLQDRTLKTVARALDQALRLSPNYVGAEHPLLGLVRVGQSVAVRVLSGPSVCPVGACREVRRMLCGEGLGMGGT